MTVTFSPELREAFHRTVEVIYQDAVDSFREAGTPLSVAGLAELMLDFVDLYGEFSGSRAELDKFSDSGDAKFKAVEQIAKEYL